MSPAEIVWRLQQKNMQKNEKKRFADARVSVCKEVFTSSYANLVFDGTALHLNLRNANYCLNEDISLLGFEYAEYKNKWHAGFQTENEWPRDFSYSLEYKQRDEIGDARTNWELNRHFQFAILAKNYNASGDIRYLQELKSELSSWNEQNSFLTGISWTSVMELAIRAINWMYALAFLKDADESDLKQSLAIGAINMIDYVEKHRSRYSSANNHLLIEAAAIGVAGFAFSYEPWVALSTQILSEELERQNYSDGVNKELSLHYQVFSMEAYALVLNLLIRNGKNIPASWPLMLKKQCCYVSDCRGAFGEVVVFGDDDEGKILDLVGKGTNRYSYILQFMSFLLDDRFDKMERIDETLLWLFDEESTATTKLKPLYDNAHNACYKEGGNTILKSKDGRILIGIDHAALGFGSIAAHGHADALSFQMFVDGKPIFIDSGTYVYHCNSPMRDKLRKTSSHNTVCVDGKDQSEMLGAFLWGRKANCRLLSYKENDDGTVKLVAEHDGYAPVVHRRTFEFDGYSRLAMCDELLGDNFNNAISVLVLSPGCRVLSCDSDIEVNAGEVDVDIAYEYGSCLGVKETSCSLGYGELCEATSLVFGISSNFEMLLKVRD